MSTRCTCSDVQIIPKSSERYKLPRNRCKTKQPVRLGKQEVLILIFVINIFLKKILTYFNILTIHIYNVMACDKRITMKLKTPNPLFEKWIKEWHQHAKENNLKTQYTFRTALASLKKYPIPLDSGKDCKILKGFGDKLCSKLDQKLREHRAGNSENNVDIQDNISPQKVRKKNISPKAKKRKNSNNGSNESVAPLDLKDCDVQHGQILFSQMLGQSNELFNEGPFCNNNKGSVQSDSTSSTSKDVAQDTESYIFAPNTFDIILYVDVQETNGKSNTQDDALLLELTRLDVRFEVKHLKVSDYLWICREWTTGNELVLPYVMERKRMDDFAQSIKDGRYYEQKFRLKKSGIENLFYLIESHGNNEHVGLPTSSLYQAATNTAIQDGFVIKFTDNLVETSKYLCELSRLFTKKYESKTLVCCTKENLSQTSDDLVFLMSFKDFNKNSAKNKRPQISDLFVKMLIQLKGMSVDRALAVVEKYPTPLVLQAAYKYISEKEGEDLLKSIKYGNFNKQIGTVLSKSVYQLFHKKAY